MTKTCEFPACSRPHIALGYCRAHYNQHREGRPLRPLQRRTPPPPAPTARQCQVDDCTRIRKARGFCDPHYKRFLRGTLEAKRELPVDLEARFFLQVMREGECWTWRGPRDGKGYGRFNSPEVSCQAHRWSYEFLRAPIPEGLVLDHLCRNRSCVNPWHLEPVTHRVNILRGESPIALAFNRKGA